MPKKQAPAAKHAEPSVKLFHARSRPLHARHPWVYRSDIVGANDIPPGALVRVHDERGKFLGTALYSSSSQIAIRMISHGSVTDLPALGGRTHSRCYRLPQGSCSEHRRLPHCLQRSRLSSGLIIDRYNDVISAQILTQAMDAEPVREAIVQTLREELQRWES